MRNTNDWKLGLWWSLATLLGFIVGLVILFAGLGAAINHFPPFLFGLTLGCTFGLTSAVMQWIALRRLVSPWWILATFAAWAIFWAINLAGFLGAGTGVIGKILEGLGHGALFGALLGLSQWLVLRGRAVNAHYWIIANVIAWSLSAALGDGIKAALGSEAPLEFVIVFILSTIILAFVLVKIFRNKSA
jgi:hypothetical protein